MNASDDSPPQDPDDDDLINELIEHNEAFRAVLAKSLASPRKPFRPILVKDDTVSQEP